MKKSVTIALLFAMLLSCLAGLGVGVQADSALDGEAPDAGSGEDVVAIGYQIKQNDDQTYDLRLVLGMKKAFEGVGVEVDVLSADGVEKKSAYARTVYSSVKDNQNNVYKASTYGCEYLYVEVIAGISAEYTFANKQLQLTITPFGANEVENELVIKNGLQYTVGKYADLWDGTADTDWFDEKNIQSEYTLTTAEEFAGFMQIRQNKKGAYYFENVTVKLANDIILNQGTTEEIKARHFLALSQTDETEKAKLLPKSITALDSANALFKGTFDGQGHTIYGVYLDCTTGGAKGLFGGLGDNGKIKNLNIENAYFNAAESKKNTGGILLARIKGTATSVSNVTVSNALMEESSAEFSGVGILIGTIDANMSVVLDNCHTSGTIDFPTKGTSNLAFGGIVGYMAEATSETTAPSLIMKNCSSSADITGTDILGGLLGKIWGYYSLIMYEDCKFTGKLTATASGAKWVGEYVSGIENFGLTPFPTNAYTHQDPNDLAEGANMRVMSFNILSDLFTKKAKLPTRLNPVLAPIYEYMPDILGLQEVSDSWHTALALFLDADDSVYAIADKKTDRGVTNFSPLLYNTQTVTLLEHGVKTFSVGDERLRVLSWGYFERKSDGARFVAINTHWNLGDADDAKKTADQVTQATEMANFVLAMKDQYKCPIITTGDYNNRYEEKFDPKEIPLKTYIDLSGMKDSREYAKVANRSYKTSHTLFTQSHRWDGPAIDHVFVSSDVEVLFYNILIDDYQKNASDHNPIYADIKLN